MNKICSKKNCNNIGVKKHAKQIYCWLCYRFFQMMSNAKRRKKSVLTWNQMIKMLPARMKCPSCNKTMVWHKSQKRLKDVITLQHNNDSKILFICYSCNSAHGNIKLGDKYLDISNNEKYCPKCDQILNKKEFYLLRRSRDSLYYLCKKCVKLNRDEACKKRKNKGLCRDCRNKISIKSKCLCDQCLKKRRELNRVYRNK